MTTKPKSTASHKGLIITLIVLVVVLAVVLFALPAMAAKTFGQPDSRLNPIMRARYSLMLLKGKDQLLSNSMAGNSPRKFTIAEDESVDSICQRLQSEAYTPSGMLFCSYLIYSGLDRMIQSGTFTLAPNLTGLEIAKIISDPTARDIQLRIYPGWRLEEIAESIDLAGFSFSGEELLKYAYAPPEDVIDMLNLPEGASLEGYFYPATYSLEPKIDLKSAVNVILAEFLKETQEPGLQEAIAQHGLNLHEALILASIIERETRASEEKATIASVFYNRLAVGMPLQTDPTVQYALGHDKTSQSWWKPALTMDDLKIDSPYNTYLYAGLPPGPISNPSLETLEAVAYPQQTPYFFFRAKCDGSGTHVFSITYEEHLGNGCP